MYVIKDATWQILLSLVITFVAWSALWSINSIARSVYIRHPTIRYAGGGAIIVATLIAFGRYDLAIDMLFVLSAVTIPAMIVETIVVATQDKRASELERQEKERLLNEFRNKRLSAKNSPDEMA